MVLADDVELLSFLCGKLPGLVGLSPSSGASSESIRLLSRSSSRAVFLSKLALVRPGQETGSTVIDVRQLAG